MKALRVNDFDPNAAPKLISPLEGMPGIQKPNRQGTPDGPTVVGPVGASNPPRTAETSISGPIPIASEVHVSIPPLATPQTIPATNGEKPLPPDHSDTQSKSPRHRDTVVSRHHDTAKPRHHETMMPRHRDTTVETVRRAVKEFGKEAATHRFTIEEKKAMADLIYTYKQQGVKTSENEIARVAINFILQDYRENGENSILAKVLKALNE